MQKKAEVNEKIDDNFVYGKLGRGEALTDTELALILDSGSIENVVKLKYDNLMTNIELAENDIEKRELKLAQLESILKGIIEYMQWQQTQAAEAYNVKINQQILAKFDSEEEAIINNPVKDDWLNNFIKSMLPEEHSMHHQGIQSKLAEALKDPSQQIDMRAIKAVLVLAHESPTLKAFIYPPKNSAHDDDKHCQLIADRILHVGSILKNIHCHDFMKEIKTYLDNEKLQQPEAKPGPKTR